MTEEAKRHITMLIQRELSARLDDLTRAQIQKLPADELKDYLDDVKFEQQVMYQFATVK